MDDLFTRIAENMVARVSGPMKFRLILQPLMASIFATLAGLKDAKAGKPPYFWGLINHPEHRRDMLKDGWKSVGKVFVLALVLDVVYQFIEQRHVFLLEVVIVACLLALVPYIILRGLVNRIARKGKG